MAKKKNSWVLPVGIIAVIGAVWYLLNSQLQQPGPARFYNTHTSWCHTWPGNYQFSAGCTCSQYQCDERAWFQ